MKRLWSPGLSYLETKIDPLGVSLRWRFGSGCCEPSPLCGLGHTAAIPDACRSRGHPFVKRAVLTDWLLEHCPELSPMPLCAIWAARALTCPTLRCPQAVNSPAPRSIQAKVRPAVPLARWAFGACGRLTRKSASHWLRQRGHFCSAV